MSDPEWWRPERLARLEAEFRERPTDDRDNDFGSYHAVASGGSVSETALHLHNDLDPGPKISAIRRCIDLGRPRSMLDVGCGAGYTSAALAAEYADCAVLGVDLSHDAIAFARRTHPGVAFEVATVAPGAEPLGAFDVIWCIEFYPFTRNADASAQAGFIRHLAGQLTPGGTIVIVMTWRSVRSLAGVYDEVREACPELDFRRITIPHPRILERLPMPVARVVSRVLTKVTGRECDKTVVLVRR